MLIGVFGVLCDIYCADLGGGIGQFSRMLVIISLVFTSFGGVFWNIRAVLSLH